MHAVGIKLSPPAYPQFNCMTIVMALPLDSISYIYIYICDKSVTSHLIKCS